MNQEVTITETPPATTSLLPAEKTPPALEATTAKVLLYGPPKIGKTTLAAGIDPDRTLFLACEPGLGGQEVFQMSIGTWKEFLTACAELAKDKASDAPRFTTIIIDTVDELAKICAADQLQQLGIVHASDAGYGKGYAVISDEFRRCINKLSGLGYGVWFISHAKQREVKTAVGDVSKIEPSLSGSIADYLKGFCDFIFYAEKVATENGEERVLRTAAGANFEAGSRIKLPDPLLLDAETVRTAMATACGPKESN